MILGENYGRIMDNAQKRYRIRCARTAGVYFGIFKYAMASGILTHNPVALIKQTLSSIRTNYPS